MGLAAFNRMRRIKAEAEKVKALEKENELQEVDNNEETTDVDKVTAVPTVQDVNENVTQETQAEESEENTVEVENSEEETSAEEKPTTRRGRNSTK